MLNTKLLPQSPEGISILGFLLLIFIGTVFLMLSIASTGSSLGFTDALFTATSASCVTGLAVVDTGQNLTLFGQLTLLFLIQAGGLGIMTISTVFLLMAGRRPGFRERSAIQDTFTHSGVRNVSVLLREIILFAVAIESLGVVLLFFCFILEKDLGDALHLSIFHAVSAFCNAGFSPFSDSFVSYQENWGINLILCFLIISGGIGFLVLSELRRRFPFNRRTWSRLSLHSKLVLSVSGILLGMGTLLVLLMEWQNTLAPLSVPGRFLAAFFQSVTLRTAGFNTLPIGNMANETLFVMILLMVIGACPGSCGGGIKTTTFSALVLMGLSRIRGTEHPHIFYRTIPKSCADKTVSLVIIAISIIIVGTLALLMTELGDVPHVESRGMFLELFFEVVSAFGTAGLSTGVTPTLSGAGKLIITVIMFVGRLGPLVIGVAISRSMVSWYYYAEENIMIG